MAVTPPLPCERNKCVSAACGATLAPAIGLDAPAVIVAYAGDAVPMDPLPREPWLRGKSEESSR
jgi:hypothetical protein